MHGCYADYRFTDLPKSMPGIGAVGSGRPPVSVWHGGGPLGGPHTDLAGIYYGPDSADLEMTVNGDLPFDVAITDGEQIVAFKELAVLRAEAAAVVGAMTPHFA
jgi:hypothetical protein